MQNASQQPARDRHWRPGAYAFLVAISIQGLPLGRDLSSPDVMFAEDRHSAALQQATTVGLENTLVVAAIWGAIYAMAAVTTYRHGLASWVRALRNQWPLTLLTALVPLSVLWATRALPVTMNAIHSVGAMLIAFAASKYYAGKVHTFVHHIALAMGLNLICQVVSVAMWPAMTINYDGRWQGLTTNPNTLGLIAATASWANFAAVVMLRGRRRWIYVALVGCGVVALHGTNSVTSMLSASISVALLAVLVRLRGATRIFAILALCLGPIIFVLAGGGAGAVSSVLLRDVGRTNDLSGRMQIWHLALRLIEVHPFFGWGFDNHARVIELTGLDVPHFHNGVLDLAVRGGGVAVGLMACATWHIVAHRKPASAMDSALVWSVLVFTFVYNLTEVTFVAPRNTLWTLFLCVAFMSIPRPSTLVTGKMSRRCRDSETAGSRRFEARLSSSGAPTMHRATPLGRPESQTGQTS